MNLRPPSPDDIDALLAFFLRVPEGERTFFKEPCSTARPSRPGSHRPGGARSRATAARSSARSR